MTHADHIEAKTKEIQFWMLPILLLQMICSFFVSERDFLRERRACRTDLPDWEDHIPDLVQAEWNIEAIKAEGARRLLSRQPIDFRTIRVLGPPQDWQPLVHNAADLLLRFEAVAAFHADPEAAIRAHAAAILAATAVRTPSWLDGRELRSLLTMRATLLSVEGALMASVEPVRCDRRSRRIDPGDQFEQRTRLVLLALHPP